MSSTAQTQEHLTVVKSNRQFGFVQVPRLVLKAKGLSYRAKCLYSLLLDYAREQDSCFPSQETLADDLDTSVDTIQRTLQELRDYGLIDWKRRGFNKPNTYSILRLSECAKLRSVQPEQPMQDTANLPPQTPQNCGFQKPQNCGSNETKSKQTQESDEESSRKPQKEEIACSQKPMTTRKPIQKPLPCIGKLLKPLTQDEIDEKKRNGMNASGYTPLANISPEHWQQLEQQARKAPVKPTATHFNVCTKNVPLVIDATLEEFTTLLGDDPGNTAININRAAKLYRESGLTEDAYREALYAAFDQAKCYSSANIKKKRPDGRPNRMPVFFAILQERLAA